MVSLVFQMSPEEKNSLTEKLAAAGNMSASTVDTKEYFKVSIKRKHWQSTFFIDKK